MKIDILTLFPEMFKGPFDQSIIRRGQDKGLVEISIHNLRDWANDKHKTVDDKPFGGGVGMILKVDVIDKAVEEIKKLRNKEIKKINKDRVKQKGKYDVSSTNVILSDASGKKFTQKEAKRLSSCKHLILIAGHYEGVDYRIQEHISDEVISIGDYILTGGELPAMVIIDSIVRLIPGVLEKSDATQFESFSKMETENSKIKNLLEYPQFTRPENYKGWKVPKVLLSGDHEEIKTWRNKKALEFTRKKRPDLLK